MKRNLTLSLLILSSLCAIAQNDEKTRAQSEDKSIALGEVVVKAAKTVNKIDGMVIYPTEAQKKSSSNGYDMLQKLSLPNIKIDAASHQVSAADNRFIYTQINQKAIDVLQSYGYASYWIVPEKLQITAYGGLYRCFNFGNDYTHCYTSWFYAGNIVAYLGNFSIVAVTDNGNRFLEGENKGYSGGLTALQVSYKLHDWLFKLTWMSPFTPRYKQYETEILNRNLHKLAVGFDKDSGNRLTLNIAWRISRGKKRQSAEKSNDLKDTDNGIMK